MSSSRTAVAVSDDPGRPIGWWGAWLLVVILTAFLGGLAASVLYLRSGADAWPPPGWPEPELLRPLLIPVLAVAAGLALGRSRRGALAGRPWSHTLGASSSALAGVAAIGVRALVHLPAEVSATEHAYGSLFHLLGAVDVLMLGIATLTSSVVLAQGLRGHHGPGRHLELDVGLVLWTFAAATSALVYAAIHLLPSW